MLIRPESAEAETRALLSAADLKKHFVPNPNIKALQSGCELQPSAQSFKVVIPGVGAGWISVSGPSKFFPLSTQAGQSGFIIL